MEASEELEESTDKAAESFGRFRAIHRKAGSWSYTRILCAKSIPQTVFVENVRGDPPQLSRNVDGQASSIQRENNKMVRSNRYDLGSFRTKTTEIELDVW